MPFKLCPSDLSVVLCGPYERPGEKFGGTGKALRHIRELLPSAQIILSTWESVDLGAEAVANLIDKLVVSHDPGPLQLVKFSGMIELSNFRRMVLSACAGIKTADRAYVMRLRTDGYLAGLGGLRHYEASADMKRASEWSMFAQPILIPTLYTRDPAKGGGVFHPSDLFHLGKREDILGLFEAALSGAYFRRKLLPHEGSTLKPEQMLWLSYLKASGKAYSMRTEHTLSPQLIHASEALMENNFIIATFATLELAFKKNFEGLFAPGNCYWQGGARSYKKSVLGVIARVWVCLALHTLQYRVAPLLFDWRASGRQWKKGLLRGGGSRIFRVR